MKIALIGGTGRLGRSLAIRLLNGGHDVLVGSRDTNKAIQISKKIHEKAQGMSNIEAAKQCQIAIITIPYSGHAHTLHTLTPYLKGKLCIDTTVPIDPQNPSQILTETGQSAAEETKHILDDDTTVFAAFQTASFHALSSASPPAEILMAGPPDSNRSVIELIESIGLKSIYVGPLACASYLEYATLLLISINQQYNVKSAGIQIVGIRQEELNQGI